MFNHQGRTYYHESFLPAERQDYLQNSNRLNSLPFDKEFLTHTPIDGNRRRLKFGGVYFSDIDASSEARINFFS